MCHVALPASPTSRLTSVHNADLGERGCLTATMRCTLLTALCAKSRWYVSWASVPASPSCLTTFSRYRTLLPHTSLLRFSLPVAPYCAAPASGDAPGHLFIIRIRDRFRYDLRGRRLPESYTPPAAAASCRVAPAQPVVDSENPLVSLPLVYSRFQSPLLGLYVMTRAIINHY